MDTKERLQKRGRPAVTPAVSPLAEAVGDRIRQRRDALGFTLGQAAALTLGMMTDQQWSTMELGTHEPQLRRLLIACTALRCSIMDVLPADFRCMFADQTHDMRKARLVLDGRATP